MSQNPASHVSKRAPSFLDSTAANQQGGLSRLPIWNFIIFRSTTQLSRYATTYGPQLMAVWLCKANKMPQGLLLYCALTCIVDKPRLHSPKKCLGLLLIILHKWPQEKQVCHSNDVAMPLFFQLQEAEDFFLNFIIFS